MAAHPKVPYGVMDFRRIREEGSRRRRLTISAARRRRGSTATPSGRGHLGISDRARPLVVKGANEFLPCADYLARLASCGIVLAPRRKEGIGMAFLEAMEMGKCVVAHDDATMNEYIVDGESGLLVDFDRPARIAPERVARARAGVAVAAARHRARWVEDAAKIVPFVQSLAPCRPGLAARAKIALEYPLYLAEGALWRLRHA